MKRGFVILMFMIMLNVSTTLVNSLPLFEGETQVTPYDEDQLSGALNGTEFAENWDPSESGGTLGDIRSFIVSLQRLNSFITAFPNMWASIGLPTSLVSAFATIWQFMWWLSIGDLMTGGKIFGS